MLRELADMLRRPEYTGDNRCLPCTVVNTILAVVAGIVISRKSRPTGLAVLLASGVLIYLRGYLLPGTPQLTSRYLPPAVLRWFGKAPDANLARGLGGMDDPEESADHQDDPEQSNSNAQNDPRSPDGEKPVPEDLDSYFRAAAIVESRADDDDLSLTTTFETAWFEMIETIDESDELSRRAVDAFGIDADPEEFDFREGEDGAYALDGAQLEGEWPSYAALVADLAAGELLDEWLDEWPAFSPQQKGDVLNDLRTFLETCPTTEGGLRRIERDDDSCCGLSTVVSVVCEETGEPLYEYQEWGKTTGTAD